MPAERSNDSSMYEGALATIDEACDFITHSIGTDIPAAVEMVKRLETVRNDLDKLFGAVEVVAYPFAQTCAIERRINLRALCELIEKQAEADDDQEDPE
jgi:hypothetical protein